MTLNCKIEEAKISMDLESSVTIIKSESLKNVKSMVDSIVPEKLKKEMLLHLKNMEKAINDNFLKAFLGDEKNEPQFIIIRVKIFGFTVEYEWKGILDGLTITYTIP